MNTFNKACIAELHISVETRCRPDLDDIDAANILAVIEQLQAKIAELEEEIKRLRADNIAFARNLKGKSATTGATYEHICAQLAAAQDLISTLRKEAETYGPEKISIQKQAWLEADRQRQINELKDQLCSAEQRVAEACDHTAWISVTDALPKPVKGVSYNKWMSDVVLVIHSDRPDYPVTAHAILGDELGAGISILTNGASDHKEIAWYSAGVDLQNPFNFKDKDYSRYLPRIFGAKITHWMPLPKAPNGASS